MYICRRRWRERKKKAVEGQGWRKLITRSITSQVALDCIGASSHVLISFALRHFVTCHALHCSAVILHSVLLSNKPETQHNLFKWFRAPSWSSSALGSVGFSNLSRLWALRRPPHKTYLQQKERNICAVWKHPPLVVSSSMGCLKRVMSLKVQRNSTTLSFSFLMGATCM